MTGFAIAPESLRKSSISQKNPEGEGMRITRTLTEITFRLDKRDWNVRNGAACRDFIAEMKRAIPEDFREFDSSTSEWTISKKFERTWMDLKTKHLINPNQPEHFEDL
jgi:hypothetical protein